MGAAWSKLRTLRAERVTEPGRTRRPATPRRIKERPHRADLPFDAVFTIFIFFLFKDDVAGAVRPHEGGSALHIRSTGRVGYRDFDINRRRVHPFFEVLPEQL